MEDRFERRWGPRLGPSQPSYPPTTNRLATWPINSGSSEKCFGSGTLVQLGQGTPGETGWRRPVRRKRGSSARAGVAGPTQLGLPPFSR